MDVRLKEPLREPVGQRCRSQGEEERDGIRARDGLEEIQLALGQVVKAVVADAGHAFQERGVPHALHGRSEEHTSELQSRGHLVCRLLLEKKKKKRKP